MDVTLTIKFQTEHNHVLQDIGMFLDSTLPYMVDNVEISSDIIE